MFRNYLKIALRNFLRFKGYTMLNTLGLAVGIAASLLIVQHVRDELRCDQFINDGDRLYRVGTAFNLGTESTLTAMSPAPLAQTLVQDYPEIEASVRLLKAPSVEKYLIQYENQSFFESKGYLVDSTFFQLFTFRFSEGNPANALSQPNSVVLSRQLAEKIFGRQSPLNKTLKFKDVFGEYELSVRGVTDPELEKSHIDGNFYINMRGTPAGQRFGSLEEWAGNNMFYTYVRLKPGASPDAFEAKLPALVEAKAGERLRTLGFQKRHFLEPVQDIYLHSSVVYPVGPTGNITMVYVFSAIALFILLIACINFMNLATAKSTIRAREVGVRKVVGASRQMLIQQFLSESFVLSFIAVLLAVVGAYVALPYFNQLAGKELQLSFRQDPSLLLWLTGITLFTALLAGSYPALYLSRFSPVNIFRGKVGKQFSAQQIRRALVVLQFIVSIALIQGIFVIQQQMAYVQSKDLGFEREGQLVVQLNTTQAMENFPALKTEAAKITDIRSVTGVSSIPGGPNIEDMLFYAEGKPQDETVHSHIYYTDREYLENMKFKLLAGRYFDEGRSADSTRSVIISRYLMQSLGYTLENAIGRKFFWNWDGTQHEQEIIGVVQDFHATTLRDAIDGHTFFWASEPRFPYLIATVSMGNIPNLINSLHSVWARFNPGEPFEFYFLDDKLQQAYLDDQRTARLVTGFTGLALFISCLGLFGLAAFAAESRTKEIGVRKVLGATIGDIISLLSRDFILLILVAILIASPLAWYIMNQWLQDFKYHVPMPWWAFGAAGLIALVLMLLTVSWHSVKAAVANPVNSLNRE